MKIFAMIMGFVPICLISCQTKDGYADAEKEIRDMLQQERKAHFDRDVELFVSEFAVGMTSVNKGVVSSPTKEENMQRIGKYFGRVEFVKWDDVADPIIRFSDDASLAYAIVQKQVIVSYADSLGKKMTESKDYAWATIYRKLNGKWLVECNVSTNK